MNVLDDLNRAVQQANGRRRDRLLTCRDIVLAALDLANGEHVFLHGGHVAKSSGETVVESVQRVGMIRGCRHPVTGERCPGIDYPRGHVYPIGEWAD